MDRQTDEQGVTHNASSGEGPHSHQYLLAELF